MELSREILVHQIGHPNSERNFEYSKSIFNYSESINPNTFLAVMFSMFRCLEV